MTASPSKPGRRTLVKGAAWSVPAIAVATQAHAQTSSPPVVFEPQPEGACKFPGNSFDDYSQAYRSALCFTNTASESATVTITSVVFDNEPMTVINVTPTNPFTVGPGEEVCVVVRFGGLGNSQQGSATVNYSYDFPTLPDGGSGGTFFAVYPPCQPLGLN